MSFNLTLRQQNHKGQQLFSVEAMLGILSSMRLSIKSDIKALKMDIDQSWREAFKANFRTEAGSPVQCRLQRR